MRIIFNIKSKETVVLKATTHSHFHNESVCLLTKCSHMGFLTAQGRGTRGDGVVPGAHQGEGQSLLQTSRQLRPPPSPEPLPGASEQGGAAGDLCSLASLWGQGLWWQTHVHTCPACKQVTHRHTGRTSVIIITVLLHVLRV